MSSISSSKQANPLNYARKEYGLYTLSADQTTDITTGNPLKFNTLGAGCSGNIIFNSATYTWTLKANKTYRMSCAGQLATDQAAAYTVVAWKTTGGTVLGNYAQIFAQTYASNVSSNMPANAIFTPTVDTDVRCMIVINSHSTTYYNNYWYAEIQEIENFAPAYFNYGQYAYVSPDFDLSVTGSNTWATIKAKGVFYKTNNGSWYLDFIIYGTVASGSRTSQDITIAGIVLHSKYPLQGIISVTTGSYEIKSYAYQSDGKLYSTHSTATTTYYSFVGKIQLNAKPTGYAIPSDV